MARKHPLLRNEIEMLQLILEDRVFPTPSYRLKLVYQLFAYNPKPKCEVEKI